MISPQAFIEILQQHIIGKPQALRFALATIFAQGHLLIEDVPGVGKTRLAKALAAVLGCSFGRIQCTPDLTPSDVLGISLYKKEKDSFEFIPGPVMNQVVLADELNRTSPRTQSSFLEAMGEGQVSVDGKTYPLPKPYLVIATQNPLEFQGTYPIPEAQRDRFMASISLGYPSSLEEQEILSLNRTLDLAQGPAQPEDILAIQDQVRHIPMASSLQRYLVELARQSRNVHTITLGLSPRASQDLFWFTKALAWIDGLDYVTPDLIQEAVLPVWAHRLVLSPQAKISGITADQILQDIVQKMPVPLEST